MAENRQEQRAGDHSVNIQGASVTVTSGLAYGEVRQVALDVFESNFVRLAGVAATVAKARAEELVDEFVAAAAAASTPVDEAANPDMQYALFSAQKAFARSGDKDLGGLLVELLVERAKAPQRDLKQIVLNESLEVAPKLTADQLDALSVIWLLRYARWTAFSDFASFVDHLKRSVVPLLGSLVTKDSCYQHLEFSGCGSISLSSISAVDAFRNVYPGLFSEGIWEHDVHTRFPWLKEHRAFLVPCLHVPGKLQLPVNLNSEDLSGLRVGGNPLPEAAKREMSELLGSATMTTEKIRARLISEVDQLTRLFEIWDGSFMKNTTLTSVGIAIASANARRQVGLAADLSIWI